VTQPVTLNALRDPQQLLTLISSMQRDADAAARRLTALEAAARRPTLTDDDLRFIRRALQTGSPFALNITQLLGIAAQSQRGFAVVAASLASLPSPALYEVGTLGLVDDGSSVSIYYTKEGAPRSWFGPVSLADVVTLSTAQSVTGAKTFSTDILLGNLGAGVHPRIALGFTYEEMTLSTSGTTTDSSANLIKAGALMLPIVYSVSVTISGGGVTKFRGGDATTSARFWSDDANITAGNGGNGVNHLKGSVATDAAGPTNAADAKLRITCDATPSAGKVQVLAPYLRGAFV
jgi:Lower baseplate protein N-terminal domain